MHGFDFPYIRISNHTPGLSVDLRDLSGAKIQVPKHRNSTVRRGVAAYYGFGPFHRVQGSIRSPVIRVFWGSVASVTCIGTYFWAILGRISGPFWEPVASITCPGKQFWAILGARHTSFTHRELREGHTWQPSDRRWWRWWRCALGGQNLMTKFTMLKNSIFKMALQNFNKNWKFVFQNLNSKFKKYFLEFNFQKVETKFLKFKIQIETYFFWNNFKF